MSFPWHRRDWRGAGEFLVATVSAGDRILAPDLFWWLLGRVERFVPENLATDKRYDWVVLDTADMPQLPRSFLEVIAARMTPAFANESFVIWAGDADRVPNADVDLRERLAGFWARLAQLGTTPSEPNRYALDAALTDAPTIVRHADLSDAELRAAMNDLYRHTGYLYPTLRDRGLQEDIRRHIAGFVDRFPGGLVLDVGSGGQRFVDISDETCLIRTDLSDVGIAMAREDDESQPNVIHAVMDAQCIAARDASFNAVLFMDAMEHVRDASRVLRESARVLIPGGWLLVSFANTASVNQVIAEKLGYPRFVTNHQHFREFSLAEVTELLDGAGFEVRETAGVSLYPYWGVPGLDDIVRHLTDHDPDIVEMLRELGRRVGAEYSYTGLVVAQRLASTSNG